MRSISGGALACASAGVVRDRDVIVDHFTVVLRDACGARTEVPATVVIRVVDRVPPNILYPTGVREWFRCSSRGPWLYSGGSR